MISCLDIDNTMHHVGGEFARTLKLQVNRKKSSYKSCI